MNRGTLLWYPDVRDAHEGTDIAERTYHNIRKYDDTKFHELALAFENSSPYSFAGRGPIISVTRSIN
jgi:hypothetical protein